jgi:hypothetical protein
MSAHGNVIVCAEGGARIEPGCLALRAVLLSMLPGALLAFTLRAPRFIPGALLIAGAFSWLRVFLLVALLFRDPTWFHAVHANSCYCVVLATAISLVIFAVRRMAAAAQHGGTNGKLLDNPVR